MILESLADGFIEIEHHPTMGVIRLNRPQTLNAVNLDMLCVLDKVLSEWRDDPSKEFVVLEGSGRAFAAGGDVRGLTHAMIAQDYAYLESAFHRIYDLCYFIATFPKPVVSLIDGICMGGGVGLSIFTPYRVISEKAVIAMPEVGIGFFPDVGASYFLNQRGPLGYWMGITGVMLSPPESLITQMATHFTKDLTGLREALIGIRANDLGSVIDRFSGAFDVTVSPLYQNLSEMKEIFALPSLKEIMAGLENSSSPWVQQWAEVIRQKSPTSVTLTFDMLKGSESLTLKECFEQDKNIIRFFYTQGDFIEGVRAFLVDRDKNPQWKPLGTFELPQFPWL